MPIFARQLRNVAEVTSARQIQYMSQKGIVLEAIQELPDNASIEQIADLVEFIAAIQKGIDDIDRRDTIPHEDVKRQLATWLTE